MHKLLNPIFRRPFAVCAVILLGFVGGTWKTHDYIVNVLRPRQQAELQARVAAQILDAQTQFKRRRFEVALSAYRIVLKSHGDLLTGVEKGRVLHEIGLCWMALAEKGNPKEALTQAIEAFRQALSHRAASLDPAGFSASQTQLGQAHFRLGQAQTDATALDKALAAYEEALTVLSRDRDPTGYAEVRMLVGNARRDAFPSGPGQKDEEMNPALAAYGDALGAAAQDAAPELSARIHVERGLAYLKLADGVYKRANTRAALADFEAALEVYTQTRHPTQFGRTQKLIGDTYAKMYNEVNVDRDTNWQATQVRYQWEERSRRAYALAAQFGVTLSGSAKPGSPK